MKQIFENHFLVAIIVYIFIVGLATIPIISLFQKIKLANERNREQLAVYQNLKIKENSFLRSSQKISCDGNLFFQAGVPITAIHVNQGNLYLSQTNNKLVVIDLLSSTPKQPAEFTMPILTDFYSNTTDIYGTDFFNDKVIKFVYEKGELVAKQYYPKIGRASAVVMDSKGYFYVSGYASGNITKIIGRDGFLFLFGLDKIVDLEASGSSRLLVARNGSKPTLVSIDLNDNKQTVIEQEKSISSLVSDGEFFWVAYDFNGKSYIGKIIGDKLVESQTLNCPFPLKIAVSSDKLFYTSLEDNEGKVYWINKNLPNNGR